MKRWQDRGEVEDSEDEELLLGSPSPERPLKLAERDGERRDAACVAAAAQPSHRVDNGTDDDDDDELAWLPAKVANTYGRKGKLTRPTRRAPLSLIKRTDHKELLSSPEDTSAPLPLPSAVVRSVEVGQNSYESPDELAKVQAVENGLGRTSKESIAASDRDLLISPPQITSQPLPISASYDHEQPSQAEPPTTPLVFADDGSSSTDSDGEDLPDVRDLFAAPKRPASPPALSSPLSERDVSPPAHLVQLHNESRGGTSSGLVSAEAEAALHDELLRQSMLDGETTGLATARRSLRARKEIQLHPYLIDKARYQRQCKERGIKPVRLVDTQPPQDHSQSQPVSSQHSVPESSSSGTAAPDDLLRGRPVGYVRLGGVENSSEHDFGVERAAKRRRINERADRAARRDVPDAASASTQRRREAPSMPPSPPRTSSETSTPGLPDRATVQTASGFRRAPNLSPAALPTPHVSSEARRVCLNDGSPRTSSPDSTRRTVPASSQASSVQAEQNISETEAESEDERIARRIQREQRRIKGVLPASWLRIDYRAQKQPQRTPVSARPRLGTSSPERSTPQRGVARKIVGTRGSGIQTSDVAAAISDDGADSDGSVQFVRAGLEQTHLVRHQDRLTIGADEVPDDDNMEIDFVDAMLAGSSRHRKKVKLKSRQPRITKSIGKGPRTANPFSEERTKRQHSAKLQRVTHGQSRRPPRTSRRYPVKLSIADSLSEGVAESAEVPLFVRLAMRQARKLPDQGRHSPTCKILHLATAEDTRDATSVLRSWREGTLAPRRSSADRGTTSVSTSGHIDLTASLEVALPGQQQIPAEVAGHAEQVQTTITSIDKPRGGGAPPNRVSRPRLLRSNLPSASSRHNRQPTHSSRANALQSRTPHTESLPGGLRDAQVETLQDEFDQSHRSAVFERRMQCLTENVAIRGRRGAMINPVAGYLQQGRPTIASAPAVEAEPGLSRDSATNLSQDQQERRPTHRSRKRQAHRLDLDAPQYWQPTDTFIEMNQDTEDAPVTDVTKPVLQGLGAFGALYPVNFGFKPLPPGQYFDQNSFIGGGELHDAMMLGLHSLDAPRGRMSIHLGDDIVILSVWNEEVSSALARLPATTDALLKQMVEVNGDTSNGDRQQAITYLLRSIVRYCSRCLSFVDQVDRQACVESLQQLILNLQDVVVDHQASASVDKDAITLILEYQVVLAVQAIQLSTHARTSQSTRRELEGLLIDSASKLRRHALTGRFGQLQSWYDDVQSGSAIALDDKHIVHTLIILNQASGLHSADSSVLAALDESLAIDVSTMCSIKHFEAAWRDLFSMLPVLCINAKGTAEDASARRSMPTDWTFVRKLMARVFELYENTSRVRGFTLDVYVRSLLHRCYTLIDTWRWASCEPILYTVYDFFSKQSRMLLKNEDCKGSPEFLDTLSSQPDLNITPDDLSFQIFLKMLATGLRVMREQHIYNDRKIGASVTYRMIPTHGRTYPKEKEMQQDDVYALRNHHDLLCTLYYASPPGHRAGLDILRHLVDHAKWHRKACQLNIKAWSMLAAFQSSTDEGIEQMQPLMAWYTDMMRSTVVQYRLARSEAEQDFHQARGHGADITEAFLYGTIATNQLQIASSLVDALHGLKRALEVASSLAVVQILVQKSGFWSAMELFDTSQRRLIPTAHESLRVIEAALSTEAKFAEHQRSSQANSSGTDSQEFGDFSVLDELAAIDDQGITTPATMALDLLSPMSAFLSNVIGADHLPDDTLLEHSVRVWVRLGKELVQGGHRTWSSYIDDYSPNSWAQMRDTKQKRKLTPYYMSCIIEQANADETVRHMVLSSWLCTLVEREAVLKFQHILTSSLLNYCGYENLLQNPPFARDLRTGRFHISTEEFRQRRLSLISSTLSNLRRTLLNARKDCPMQAPAIKSQYADMLRRLMNTMKHNYSELQTDQSTDVADEGVRGSYVEFVQNVVYLLQEYTADICHIDKYFTDSSAFPLPAADPTYVVGKLKGYALKLEDPGPRRELAMFVQSVSERAAVDGQQQYLVTQMATAMSSEAENGDSTAPTLRHVLLTSIFPAYLDLSFSSACGWVLSLPLLDTCRLVLQDMLYTIDINSEASTVATTETLTGVLHSIYGLFDQALTTDVQINDPAVLRLLNSMCRMCKAALSTTSCVQRLSRLQRLSQHGSDLLCIMRALYTRSRDLQHRLAHEAALGNVENLLSGINLARPWADTRAFAERQVHDAIVNWYVVDGKCCVRRANMSREVEIRLGCSEEEGAALSVSIADFQGSYEATFDVREMRRQQIVDEDICGIASLYV